MPEALTTRPAKRLRQDTTSTPLERDKDVWYEDGNLVLVTQNVGFCVYRGVLATHSTVFSDMVKVGKLQGEMYDGIPRVEVTDSPADLRHFLQALFPEGARVRFFPKADKVATALSFHQVSAVIRLAHKYQVEDLLQQGLTALRGYYTDDFRVLQKAERAQYFTSDSPTAHCIAAVNLARLTDTPSILPLALYQCYLLGSAVLHGFKREDGTVERLDKGDEVRFMKGGSQVMLAWQRTSYTVLEKVLAQTCRYNRHLLKCSSVICATLRKEVIVRPDVFSSHWKDLATNTNGVCESCASWMEITLKSGSETIWRKLPKFFSVTVPGWNDEARN